MSVRNSGIIMTITNEEVRTDEKSDYGIVLLIALLQYTCTGSKEYAMYGI